MIAHDSKLISVHHVIEGLSRGLTRFSGPSRTALLMAETQDSPLLVLDPCNLLRGHEPKLKEIFVDNPSWRAGAPDTSSMRSFGQIVLKGNLYLSGLVSRGGWSRPLFFQNWFTDHHPNMCSLGPTEKWLEHAVWLLSHDFASEGAFFTAASKHALEGFEIHAISNYLDSEQEKVLDRPSSLQAFPILEAVLGISSTMEEGHRPHGRLVFVEYEDLEEINWMVRFPAKEAPLLQNHKHVRKLLQAVERSRRCLVCDGERVYGIGRGDSRALAVTAEYKGGAGFVRLGDELVCSFRDGRFGSSTMRPNLVVLEEILLELVEEGANEPSLFQLVFNLVESAQSRQYGCTLVIDLREHVEPLPGQQLKTPIDLREPTAMDLAKSLAKVDGALHISGDGSLRAFACLLDGRSVPSEDRSRGARFNSALRFTAEHQKLIVVVVSEDRPVTVFQNGARLGGQSGFEPGSCQLNLPPSLEDWLKQ